MADDLSMCQGYHSQPFTTPARAVSRALLRSDSALSVCGVDHELFEVTVDRNCMYEYLCGVLGLTGRPEAVYLDEEVHGWHSQPGNVFPASSSSPSLSEPLLRICPFPSLDER
eukprot:869832-Rhodomonas_salina.2